MRQLPRRTRGVAENAWEVTGSLRSQNRFFVQTMPGIEVTVTGSAQVELNNPQVLHSDLPQDISTECLPVTKRSRRGNRRGDEFASAVAPDSVHLHGRNFISAKAALGPSEQGHAGSTVSAARSPSSFRTTRCGPQIMLLRGPGGRHGPRPASGLGEHLPGSGSVPSPGLSDRGVGPPAARHPLRRAGIGTDDLPHLW